MLRGDRRALLSDSPRPCGEVLIDNGGESMQDRVVEHIVGREMNHKIMFYRAQQHHQCVGVPTKLKEIAAGFHLLSRQVQRLREDADQGLLNLGLSPTRPPVLYARDHGWRLWPRGRGPDLLAVLCRSGRVDTGRTRPPREPPVPVAYELHTGRDKHTADDRDVDED